MRALTILILLLLPIVAQAQMAATLVADDVVVTADNRLIASGNIEALYDGTRLQADRVTYDQRSDRLTIDGPILITGPDGEILTAQQATLDPQLENGLLLGARLVLNQQVQIAANQIDRSEGRYSQLYKTAVTSCRVCGTREPLWSIRAERVVVDDLEEQLYLTNATFRVKGVPILYLPQLRLPTPSNGRATGLLPPRFVTTDRLGPGIRLPYFITLGDSRDLTLTPYLGGETRTLGARYRQAFGRGGFEIVGAVSSDTLTDDGLRGYLTAQGSFLVASDLTLSFDLQDVSDQSYLSDYNISDADRLASIVALTRVTDDSVFSIAGSYYETLRDDETDATLPPVVLTAGYLRQYRPDFGGILTVQGSTDSLLRYGTQDSELARDLSRIGVAATWARDWITPGGIAIRGTAALRTDAYQIGDRTAARDTSIGRAVPTGQIALRYPLIRDTGNGTRHLLEPAVALTVSEAYGNTPPNEDSTRQELDEANLLSLTHFPGEDSTETGIRLATGITWTRQGAEGIRSILTFGKLLRDRSNPDFTVTSGLESRTSDWLIAGQLTLPRGLTLDGRTLMDGDGATNLTTARAYWSRPDVQLAAGYIYQRADADIGRPDPVSEYSFDGAFQLTPQWAVSLDARYDIAQNAPARAGFGVGWSNECVNVTLSVSRRYATSTTVQPTTDYGLSLDLLGFASRAGGVGAAGRCDT
ncbi:LPS assembly protein LptD [Loktanella sp. SALINAS62]|uniref:LPS-assembly protein LptD n=1 Tax=Loktanella sp. SALINAS62 TaxID=2706124 RepID=UPI001B8B4059|nr:LPS assembly protein LptD [Loktanella sp. SALINAS62]MBS1304143.1 LPS-assembly protein LptD [Loktanella sp. SALINAS62]